ncbi:MAG: hypothetical protein IJJ92_06240 [Clostridia bacterium]|nr:hypothetical protein [Clostridia bacterium]
MKRWIIILLALLILLPSVASADVIVEPENSFFWKHQQECSHIEGRTYLANGPDGALSLYPAPGSAGSKTIPNGEALYCEWIYTDKEGNVWGYSQRHELWAPLGYTRVQYDNVAFRAENKDKIVPNDGRSVPAETPKALYEYPGASNPFLVDMGESIWPEELYVDAQGRTWGSVGYYYGIRNTWVCLDDPANENLQGEAKDPLPSGFSAPKSLPSGSRIGIILYVVGGIMLLSAAAVLILFRKKKHA